MKKNSQTNRTNLKQKLFFLTPGVLSVLTVLSSSCLASCASTITNHENDYIHQVVSDRPAPVTPEGLSPINTKPVFVIPAGSNTYPAEKSNVNLKPPTLSI